MTQTPFLRDPTLSLDDRLDGGATRPAGHQQPSGQIELHLDPNYRSAQIGGASFGKIPPQMMPASMPQQPSQQPRQQPEAPMFTASVERPANQISANDRGHPMHVYDHQPPARSARQQAPIFPLRYALMALITVVVLALAGYFLLSGGATSVDPSALPLIAGDGSPVRVKPSDPGGLEVPNQDALIYQELLGRKPEIEATVASPVETPVSVTAQMQPSASAGSTTTAAAGAAPPPAAQASTAAAGSEPAPVAQASTAATPAVPSSAPAAAPVAVPAANQPAAQADPPKPSAPVADAAKDQAGKNAKAQAGKNAKAQAGTNDGAKPATQASAGKTAAAFTLPESKAVVRQPLRLQLAAVRTQSDAQTEWQRLQLKFPSLREYALDVRPLNSSTGDKPSGAYRYRVLAGPMPDRATANQVCQTLKSRAQGCSVVDLSGTKE
ncbi:MAG: SPOR domain-containing protein [Alphaproteobacteria bacterium]|nr:SPOR domain-containing protein [Alphaproteobacteria bacterium]